MGCVCKVTALVSGCVLLLKTNTLTVKDRDAFCPFYSPTPVFTLSPLFLTGCSAYTAIPPALPLL